MLQSNRYAELQAQYNQLIINTSMLALLLALFFASSKHKPHCLPSRKQRHLAAQLNAASLEALLNSKGDRSRNSALELRDLGAVDRLAEGGLHHIRAHGEQLVGDLPGAKVLAVERSDERGGRAVGVELRVDGALVEGGHLELRHGVGDDAAARGGADFGVVEDAVLGEHLNDQAARGDDLQLGGARVHVRSVEAAGPEEANCHAGAGADESREGLAVRSDEVTALSALAFESWVAEVEDELGVFGEQGEAVCCCVGEEELLSEGGAGCCRGGSWRRSGR